MATKAVISLAFASAASAAVHHGNGFLAGSMQPDVAAHTLAAVEEEWQAQASMFVECSNATGDIDADPLVDCQRAPKAFAKSCNKVVSSMVRGSKGDRDDAREYLDDVCSQDELKGSRADRCRSLADGITSLMTSDAWENRNSLKTDSLCSNMWSQLMETEQVNMQKENLNHQQEEQKDAEAAKEAAEEAAKRVAAQKLAAEETAKAAEAAKKQAEKEATAKAVQEKKAKVKAEAAVKAKVEAAAAEKRAQAFTSASAEKRAQALTAAAAQKRAKGGVTAAAAQKVEKPAEKTVEKKAEEKASTEKKPTVQQNKTDTKVAPIKLVIDHKKA